MKLVVKMKTHTKILCETWQICDEIPSYCSICVIGQVSLAFAVLNYMLLMVPEVNYVIGCLLWMWSSKVEVHYFLDVFKYSQLEL